MLFLCARMEDYLNPVEFNSYKIFRVNFIVTHNL